MAKFIQQNGISIPSFSPIEVERPVRVRTAVLTNRLRIGDEVIMHMDPEARGWGRKAVPDGTLGVVIGFNHDSRYRGRVNEFGRKPGLYSYHTTPIVVWETGEMVSGNPHDLLLRNYSPELEKARDDDKSYIEVFDAEIWIGELPVLDFCEGDVVTSNSNRSTFGDQVLKITKIDYDRIGDTRTDGSPYPILHVTPIEEGYGHSFTSVDEVILKERGNVWKWYNDQRDQLKFTDLRDEVNFYFSLGRTTCVKCEASGNYHWPAEVVLAAAEAGTIDVLQSSGGFFGGGRTISAYKLHDEDIGNRCRAELIKGFSK